MPLRGFYMEYHGHTIDDLEALADDLPQGRGVIYLVGDSTMDNKYWIKTKSERACNGYERCLANAKSVPDVAYWMNVECERRGLEYCCINAAIEESTLGLRDGGKLLPQDDFVKRRLTDKDVVVVSMGGNDIALRPTISTIVWMLALVTTPLWLLKLGIAPGLSYFIRLFKGQGTKYLQSIITPGREPKCVGACMLYYLDERAGGSWADFTLSKLGYDKEPSKLQHIIREVYNQAVCKISLGSVVPVVPIPMYEALDGKTTSDYVQRVEPSSQGGQKLAKLIMDRLEPSLRAEGRASSGAANSYTSCADSVTAMPASVHNARM